eukprot:gene11705-24523_t
MGNTKSSLPLKNHHKSPDLRIKNRYENSESNTAVISQDSTTDKYDYLIVFATSDGSKTDNNEITWKDVEKIWPRYIPGTDDVKKSATNNVSSVWKRSGQGKRSRAAWLGVVEEAIINQLSMRAGLQLQKTTVSNYVFCRLRAPIKLLEQQAKREGYRLQLRGEVDPGSEEFWNVTVNNVPVELEEDRKLYTKEEANAILSRLHRVGKISAMDMTVNALKENQRTWSRRVHVLERIADKVPVSNTYPAYTPFTSEPHLRYLFQPHTGVRGKTLLRAKDRLYLTKAIIDRYFDLGKLVEDGLIASFMPLHDANRGEDLTNQVLQRRWATFWRASATEVGSPLVTDESYHEDKPLSWYLRPFAQPLGNVREYMGEKVALHFAWLGCYTYNMIAPTVLGTAFAAYEYSTGYSEAQEGINVLQVLFILFMVAWSVSYKENWTQQERAIALKWGTLGFEEAEKDRPQFKGDVDKPFERSVITNRRETYFPKAKRRVRKLISLAVVWVSVLILIMLVALVYYLEYFLRFRKGYAWGSTLCSVISAVQINVLSYTYGKVSDALNDWENHRTQTAFEDNLTLKTFSFEVFNSFAALTYICFFKGTVFHICTNDDCISDLKTQLLTIYVIRYVIHIYQIIEPSVMDIVHNILGKTKISARDSEITSGEAEQKAALIDQQYLTEFNRPPHEGTYRKYAEVVLQYGYLVLFAPAWPLICVLSLVDNLTGMRVEAWRQCAVMRRPEVYLAEDVGMWKEIMDAMTVLGIYFNVAIFVWTGKSLENYSLINKVLLFFIASQVLLMLKLTLQGLFGGFPQWILDIEARQKYIVRKCFQGVDDNESLLGDKSGSISSTLPDDCVDVDGLSLYDFRGDSKMTKAEMRENEELERKRRGLQQELLAVKGQLDSAYKTENFNVQTGIGETKDGIPLGLLNVRVMRLQYPDSVDMSSSMKLYIRVNVVSKETAVDIGVAATTTTGSRSVSYANNNNDSHLPAAVCTDSGTATCTVSKSGRNGVITYDMTLGPFVAVRTMQANVLVEVVLAGPEIVVASGSFPLSAVSDQLLQEKQVTVMTIAKKHFDCSSADVFMFVQFQYSKIVPLREQIVKLQDALVDIERSLSLLKSGQRSTTGESATTAN